MRFFDDQFLRRMRNNISFSTLFQWLPWPHKRRNGQLAFVCPRCGEYRSSVNPRTNLAHCFFCHTYFNPIDFTMAAREWDFVQAVHELKELLPAKN